MIKHKKRFKFLVEYRSKRNFKRVVRCFVKLWVEI